MSMDEPQDQQQTPKTLARPPPSRVASEVMYNGHVPNSIKKFRILGQGVRVYICKDPIQMN